MPYTSSLQKKPPLSIPARASFFSIGTNIAAKAISVIFTSVFTRILLPNEFGEYALFAGWVGIIGAVSTFELGGSVLYRGMQKWRQDCDAFLSSAFGLLCLFLFSSAGIYFLFRDKINALTGLSSLMSSMIFLDIFFNAALNFYSAKYRYFYKHKLLFLINLSYSLLSQLIAVLLITRKGAGGYGRIYGTVITAVLLGFPLLLRLLFKGKRLFDKGMWKFLLLFNLPLLPSHIAHSVSSYADRIIVKTYFGDGALAKYSVALSAGLILSMIVSGMNSALVPWIFRKTAAGEGERVRQVGADCGRLIAIFTLMFLAVAPECFGLLAPKEYSDTLAVIYPAAVSVTPSFFTTLLTSAQMRKEKNIATMASSVISATAGVLANLFILPKSSVTAASIILLATTATQLLLLSLFAKKTARELFAWRELSGTLLFLSGGATVLYFLKSLPPVRILVLVLLAVLLAVEGFSVKDILLDKG